MLQAEAAAKKAKTAERLEKMKSTKAEREAEKLAEANAKREAKGLPPLADLNKPKKIKTPKPSSENQEKVMRTKKAKTASKAKANGAARKPVASKTFVVAKLSNNFAKEYDEKVNKGKKTSFAYKIWNAIPSKGTADIEDLVKKCGPKTKAYVNWHVTNERMKKSAG